MALADTAKLVASLELDDRKFKSGAASAERSLSNLERKTSTIGRVGAEAGRGLGVAAHNLRNIALVGAGVVATQVVAGIRSLTELEEAMAQTEARIESTGGAANVTADDVRELSESLESLTTVDDKAIQAGQNMLLTFTNIRNEVGEGNDIFNQATTAILDLSVAMGTEPQQAALQLGKALNDPVRGLTALRRVGIQFTEDQEKQIQKMVEAGDTMGAQKVILAELNKEFGGSAEAFAQGPGATMRRFSDAVETGQQALARGLLPVLEQFSQMAQEAFSDPRVIAGISEFGKGLGQGLTQLIEIAQRLPWDAIGSSLKIAGTGARAVLTAFTNLPPWVQTAVLTGWGLNKLTGGALGNIARMLGKSAFGAIRGGTPATPVFTKEVGLGGATGGGAAPVAAGGAGRLATAAKFILGPAAAVLIGSEIAQAINAQTINPAKEGAATRINAVIEGGNVDSMKSALAGIENQLTNGSPLEKIALGVSDIPIIGDALGNAADTLEAQRDLLRQRIAQAEQERAASSAFASSATQAWSKAQAQAYQQIQATQTAGRDTSAAVRTTAQGTATQLARIESVGRDTAAAARGTTATLERKNFNPTINTSVEVNSTVSVNDVVRATLTQHVASGVRGGFSEF